MAPLNTLNVPNRTLYHGDNLDFMRGLNSASVDLIATDPPFNKGRDFHATPESLASGARFQDRWSWKDIYPEWKEQIQDDWPTLWSVISTAEVAYGEDMGAFICWLGVRVIEMHRILKPTGSLYLHCDPTASHYIKTMLDAVFGKKNFRNEIVWKRQTSNNAVTKKFGAIADYILFYVKTDGATFNTVYHKRSEAELKNYRRDGDGRLYKAQDLTAPFSQSSRRFEWRGTIPAPSRNWKCSLEKLEELWAAGRIKTDKNGCPLQKGHIRYLDEMAEGQRGQSIWTDILRLGRGKERTGYPTQKPLALYERMIKASSNEGDVVLDPFCGCATTLVSAERLGRQWIGADIWNEAYKTVLLRLYQDGLDPKSKDGKMKFNEMDATGIGAQCVIRLPGGDVHYTKEVPQRTDDGFMVSG